MFVPFTVSNKNPELSVVYIQDQFFIYSRHGIAQWRGPVSFISGFHPKANCDGFEVWHAACDDDRVITGTFSRKVQRVIICCKKQ